MAQCCDGASTCPFSELRLQLINPSTSPNELNTTLTPHSIIHGDACFAYFNKIGGIPRPGSLRLYRRHAGCTARCRHTAQKLARSHPPASKLRANVQHDESYMRVLA